MANNVTNIIKIIATEEAMKAIDDRFELAGGYGDMEKFVKAFYENPELTESGAVLNNWSLDHVGSKWAYVENCIDEGEWNIQSANYAPKEFYIHLYKLITETDPEGYLEVRYEDESLSPVGALVIKKGPNGEICFKDKEDYDMEDPTADMEWDDEGYDNAQMNFTDEKFEAMDNMVEMCNRMIDEGDGEIVVNNQ